jgi:type I restriction-modification system DNA methylase subunit
VEIAGDKAFNWQNSFPKIFEKGGFDVIIGNPPYVVLSSFKDNTVEYLQKKYKTSFGRLNTFALFIEQITNLIKEHSNIGLIIPDSLCLIDYYTNLRKHLLDSVSIEQIIELGDGVFADATVPAIILILGDKKEDNQIKIGSTNSINNFDSFKTIAQKYYYTTQKLSFNLSVDDIFIKLNGLIDNKKVFALKELIQIKIGVCTGSNEKHIANKPIYTNSKKVLQGKDINKYSLVYNNLYINYDRKELLRAREEEIFLKGEKLLMRQTSDRLIISYDDEKYYTIDSLFILYPKDERILLKYLLPLLNSKLLTRQYQKINPEAGRVFAQVKIDYVNEIPIIVASNETQDKFIKHADLMLALNKQLQEVSQKFQRTIQRKFELEELPKKLQDWYKLPYPEFIKELVKKKVKLSLSQEAEWEDYFIEESKKALELKATIDATDKAIDKMVYELYGLSEEEIQIVENS